MMLNRLRSRQRHTTSSGLATWCRDQMAVRHDQAVSVNEGAANEEPKFNEITDLGDGTSLFSCDLPLMDEAAAADAFTTLADPNVLGQSLALESDLDTVPSWVENHTCDHDEAPRSGCVVVSRQEGSA